MNSDFASISRVDLANELHSTGPQQCNRDVGRGVRTAPSLAEETQCDLEGRMAVVLFRCTIIYVLFVFSYCSLVGGSRREDNASCKAIKLRQN